MATLAAVGVLATLAIALLGARNYFPPTYYPFIFILLAAIFFALILGLYGSLIIQKFKYYSEKKKHDRLAKSNFEQFKKVAVRFKEFTEGRDDNMQNVMQSIKNNIPAPNPFSQINVVQPHIIEERYNHYMKWLNQFDGSKDSLLVLTKEFEGILNMYDVLYIKEPVQKIRNIVNESSPKQYIPKQYQESYNKARQKYINFRLDYVKFAKDANEDFNDKEDLGLLGGRLYFRDYFEQPDEL